jgi:hypothetical protein
METCGRGNVPKNSSGIYRIALLYILSSNRPFQETQIICHSLLWTNPGFKATFCLGQSLVSAYVRRYIPQSWNTGARYVDLQKYANWSFDSQIQSHTRSDTECPAHVINILDKCTFETQISFKYNRKRKRTKLQHLFGRRFERRFVRY